MLQFEPWPTCSISVLFWKHLAERKLSDFKNQHQELHLTGFYQPSKITGRSCSLFLTVESFASLPAELVSVSELGEHFVTLPGKLILADTIEELKSLNVQAELKKVIEKDRLSSPLARLSSFADLTYFVVFAHANVKTFKFSHLVCYPVPIFDGEQIQVLGSETVKAETVFPSANRSALQASTAPAAVHTFWDTSRIENVPGWPLRQLLSNLAHLAPESVLEVACQRSNETLKLRCRLPSTSSYTTVGGVFSGFQSTNISTLMDPKALALQASELNLKLMKWRLVPDLDLDTIRDTKCLLIGAGTLGCAVTRILLGWGVKNVTLVDNGHVSYSNPVRQSLFTFEDAKAKSAKAETAALRAREIDPNANVQGIALHIPMPGHPIINPIEFEASVARLQKLIASHDALFLLTDSRESRWLPALIGHSLNRLIITTGLGFDSYVVMRHGTQNDRSSCYFCHDVVGPTDVSHKHPLLTL
jgi:ubiquitin-like modifier-activating enzyme ATG7